MTPGITSVNPLAQTGEQAVPATTAAKAKDIDKNMFLQLLIAQLRHQDPMKPSDGTAFIAQLAQFQQLEQSINAGQDIAAMRGDLEQFLASASSTTSKS